MLLFLVSLSACNYGGVTEDVGNSLIDVIEEELGFEAAVPVEKAIIEEQLMKQLNNALFYSDPDNSYIHNLSGYEVDYLVTGIKSNVSDEYSNYDGVSYDFTIILSPKSSELDSAYSGMGLHVEETNDGTSKYWWDPSFEFSKSYYGNYSFMTLDSLKALERENYFSFLFALDKQEKSDEKVYYKGTIFVDESKVPKVADFPEKEAIISEIFEWIEQEGLLSYYTEDDQVNAYMQNFDRDSAQATVFLIPKQGITHGAMIKYNLFREHQDLGRLNGFFIYKDKNVDMPKHTAYLAERVIEFPIATKKYR
jgi:hypothetical protein